MEILIVEDDNVSVEILREFLKSYDLNDSVKVANSIKSAKTILQEFVFDLVFLDVHLEDGLGTELVDEFHFGDELVFITSDPDYALTAFEMNALDYLLKPVTKERFDRTITRVKENEKQPKKDIIVRVDYNFQRIELKDIYFVKSSGDYLTIRTKKENITFYGRLKNLLEKLPDTEFKKCHRSYIINTNEVTKVNGTSVLIGGTEIPISKRHRKEMNNFFNAAK